LHEKDSFIITFRYINDVGPPFHDVVLDLKPV